MPDACFTYGTLMCEDIFVAVAGVPCRSICARLDGYARHPVRGELYPGIRPCAGMHVDGRLYLDLSASAVQRLDRFEGSDYVRQSLEVTTTEGGHVPAWVYVFHPECYHRLAPGAWDVHQFLATGKRRFLGRDGPPR